jgi:hypothetical protein
VARGGIDMEEITVLRVSIKKVIAEISNERI